MKRRLLYQLLDANALLGGICRKMGNGLVAWVDRAANRHELLHKDKMRPRNLKTIFMSYTSCYPFNLLKMKPAKKIYRNVTIAFFSLMVAAGCRKSKSESHVLVEAPRSATVNIIKGADISWLTQMESVGRKFYNSAGVEQDCFQIFKGLGANAIRLRVWVNPANNWNTTSDVVAKAVRAKNAGLKVLIDFHYSDSWADPGNQTKPAAWSILDFSSLKLALANHTTNVLNELKANGIRPEWVQVGNETNNGMLWPDGKATESMSNFAQLITAGYSAVKSIDTSIKVVVHISNGWDNGLFRWIFDGLKKNGAQWDIIGMSLYPGATDWVTKNEQCLANMNDMVSRYNKDVMVVEVGMSWDQADACQSFLSDLISKVKSVAGGRGLGMFYWEPESYNNWLGYKKGAFDNTGKPTQALSAFK